MTSTEMKSLNDRYERLNRELARLFSTQNIKGQRCYVGPKETFFFPTLISSWGAIVIEYAHGIREAVLNQYEDGDRFYLDELDDEALLAAVLAEIEQ